MNVQHLHTISHPNPQKFPKIIPKVATPKKTASGRWWIQIEVAGQRESGTFDTRSEANIWAARKSTEMRAMRGTGAGKIKSLRDAMRRYAEEVSPGKKGERWETIRLAAFEKPDHAALRIDRKLAEVTSADISAWRDARLAMVSRSTVLRDMTLISSVFEVAKRDWGWVDGNPVKAVRKPAEPDHRERIISGPEVRRMLRQLGWPARQPDGHRKVRSVSEAVAVCFMLALATGMRAGELCGLLWSDVRTDQVTIRDGKTGRRIVPLTPAAARLIAMLGGFDTEIVFGLKVQTLDALFRRARDRSGLSGFTFHDSRHTAATRLAQRLHVLDLCKVFGWKQTSRALTYYNPSASDLAKRMAG